MNKLKDLIYNMSDILIAFFILIIASLVIIWRMQAVMDYPAEIIKEDTTKQEIIMPTPEDFPSTEDEDEDEDAEGEEETEVTELWVDGILQEDVTVDLNGTNGSASAIVGKLIDAGLFENYSEYQSVCASAGLKHDSVLGGVRTFTAGMTKEDVARKINASY